MSIYVCNNCGNRCGMYGHVDLTVPFNKPAVYRCERPEDLVEKLAKWRQWFSDNPDER